MARSTSSASDSAKSSSEYEEDADFVVEDIVAERDVAGYPEYLIKWEGYPDVRNSWAPAENFHDTETLDEWNAKKARQDAGEEPSFDIDSWQAKVDYREERLQKKRNRRARHERELAIQRLLSKRQTQNGGLSDDSSADDGVEMPNNAYRKGNKKQRLSSDLSHPNQSHSVRLNPDRPGAESKAPPTKRQRVDQTRSVLDDTTTKGTARTDSNSIARVQAGSQISGSREGWRGTAEQSTGMASGSSRERPKMLAGIPPSSLYNSLKPVRKKATAKKHGTSRGPGRPPIEQIDHDRDVMAKWTDQPDQRKITTANSIDPTVTDSKATRYKKMSKQNRQTKFLSNERAPEADKLTLYDTRSGEQDQSSSGVSRWTAYKPVEKYKSPWELAQEQGENIGEGSDTPNYLAPESSSRAKEHRSALSAPAVDIGGDTLFIEEALEQSTDDVEMKDTSQNKQLIERRASAPDKHNGDKNTGNAAEYFLGSTVKGNEKAPDALPKTRRVSLPNNGANRPPPPAIVPTTNAWQANQKIPGLDRPVKLLSLDQMKGDIDMMYGYGTKEYRSDIYGSIVLGKNKYLSRRVIFRGLSKSGQDVFLTNKSPNAKENLVWLSERCTVAEYITHYHKEGNGYIGGGHVVSNWEESRYAIEEIARQLSESYQGGVYISKHFTMLVYPAGASQWNFFDQRFDTPIKDTKLRFIIRSLVHPPVQSSTGHSEWKRAYELPGHSLSHQQPEAEGKQFETNPQTSFSTSIVPQSHNETRNVFSDNQPHFTNETVKPPEAVSRRSDHLGSEQTIWSFQLPLHFTEQYNTATAHNQTTANNYTQGSGLNTTMAPGAIDNMTPETVKKFLEQYWNIKVKDLLVLANGKEVVQNPVKIFLHYPQERQGERDVFIKILEVAEGLRAKVYYDVQDEWHMFSEGRTKSGLVIFHESIYVNQVPRLGPALYNGDMNFFSLGMPDQNVVGGYLKRIFPTGIAFLILDSAVLHDTDKITRILRWYRRVYNSEHKGRSWTFMVRPRFRAWVTQVYNERLSQSSAIAEPFKRLFAQLDSMAPLEAMDPSTDYETPLSKACYREPESINGLEWEAGIKNTSSDPELLAKNDDLMVAEFGKWSLKSLDQHRKFSIITPSKQIDGQTSINTWRKALAHLLVVDPETFMKQNRVGQHEEDYRKWEEQKRQKGNATPVTPTEREK